MKIEQLYTACLSEMTYYIGSEKEAAIIDPLRETETYLRLAEKNGTKIKYIFLTHFHADFVSGQVDLANKTGATIVFGPNANPSYKIHHGKDGEIFNIGAIQLKLLHTPGHTLESSSYLLIDENQKTACIFTGDCLFIGDVGRPDLAIDANISETDLAGYLFDSLRHKIMPLPDDIIIYPNHGEGSACGKNMDSKTFDSLGNQKKTNYALRADMTKSEFITAVTSGLKPPPAYFKNNAKMNKNINLGINSLIKKNAQPIEASKFKVMSNKDDILVIDARPKEMLVDTGSIHGALFIGLEGDFSPLVGSLVKDINQKIIFISEAHKEQETVKRFSRVGYDSVLGYLKGGLDAWKNSGYPVSNINNISPIEFAKKLEQKIIDVVLDVRKESDYLTQHIIGAENIPLETLQEKISELDTDKTYYVYCTSCYLSLIASSIFKAHSLKAINIKGGIEKVKEANVNILT